MAAKEKTDHLEDLQQDRSPADGHPVGAGVGVAGGAVAGAAAGAAMGGPVAAVVGGVIGAVAGGLIGRDAAGAAQARPRGDRRQDVVDHDVGVAGGAMSAAAAGGGVAGPLGAGVGAAVGAGPGVGQGSAHGVNHDEEDAYWRENHVSEPYYNPGRSYDDYGPAYRMGWESRARYDEGTFDTYEPSFRNDWDESYRAQSRLTWAEARHAARAGWERFERKGKRDDGGR